MASSDSPTLFRILGLFEYHNRVRGFETGKIPGLGRNTELRYRAGGKSNRLYDGDPHPAHRKQRSADKRNARDNNNMSLSVNSTCNSHFRSVFLPLTLSDRSLVPGEPVLRNHTQNPKGK